MGGTIANATAASYLLRPYQGVLCAASAHITAHEAGAIEAGGNKVLTIPSEDGKLTPGQIDPGELHRVHMLLVPPLAELHRHRHRHRLGHRLGNPPGQQGVFHQGGAAPVARHLGGGAAHIQVDLGPDRIGLAPRFEEAMGGL